MTPSAAMAVSGNTVFAERAQKLSSGDRVAAGSTSFATIAKTALIGKIGPA